MQFILGAVLLVAGRSRPLKHEVTVNVELPKPTWHKDQNDIELNRIILALAGQLRATGDHLQQPRISRSNWTSRTTSSNLGHIQEVGPLSESRISGNSVS